MSPFMNELPDDNDSTLPGLSVYQTPVLEASRCGEREAERRRERPRVARREQHAGVHVAGGVVLRGVGGGAFGVRSTLGGPLDWGSGTTNSGGFSPLVNVTV